MKYGSVCSGVEAATLAWHPLGWQPVFFAEVEPFPCAVLQQRFNATKPLRPLDPAEAVSDEDRAMRESWLKQIEKLPNTGTIPNLGDFTKIKRDDYDGEIDLLVGGTPCQDLSVAGKRAGFDGHRSSLALDFVRLAYELGCKWFVWENVPGVFSSNGGGDFATLLSLFCGREIGIPKQGFDRAGFVCPDRADRFGVAWRVLDAQYVRTPLFPFAVPQRRRRVFVVGHIGHWERAAEVLLDPKGVSWNPPARIRAKQRVALGSERGTGETVKGYAEPVTSCLAATYSKGWNNDYKERTIVKTEDEDDSLLCFHGSQDPIINNSTSNPVNRNQGQENCILATGGHSDGFCEPVACSLEATYYKGCSGIWNERTIVSDVFSLAGGQAHQTQHLGVNVNQPLTNVNGGYSYIAYENHGNDSRVTESGDVSPVLTSRIGTGGGNTPLVQRTEESEMKAVDLYNGSIDDVSPTCRSASATDCTHIPSVMESEAYGISFDQKFNFPVDKEISQPQTIGTAPGRYRGCIQQATVRRLTPVECERLMGQPDNHTQIEWNGKSADDCPDAPRYKACGNSMCVNVMEWIGRRIEEMERKTNGND